MRMIIDHITLSGSPHQQRRAIEITKRWSAKNNIKLNTDKSSLLEIPPKYQDLALRVGTSISEIPVVDKYKYLGVWIDQKLSLQTYLEYLFEVKKKEGETKGKKG